MIINNYSFVMKNGVAIAWVKEQAVEYHILSLNEIGKRCYRTNKDEIRIENPGGKYVKPVYLDN